MDDKTMSPKRTELLQQKKKEKRMGGKEVRMNRRGWWEQHGSACETCEETGEWRKGIEEPEGLFDENPRSSLRQLHNRDHE